MKYNNIDKHYYDSLNQLIREDNAWLGKTIAYTYDKGGNIQLVEEYTLTSGALDGLTATNSYSYLYGDSNWKDKLTSYNGNTITYDQIGNPINYYNGITFTWQDGRQLAGLTTASGDGILYTYNADGIRTSKTVNGVTTDYTLEGNNVVRETNGTDTIWYYYDANDDIIGFELNGTAYYYVKNVQGDIIAIVDDSGNKVVEYVYDSWGKLISTTGSLANTVGVKNPYRYRGYRYDTETGLYYLQSRYYDPEMKRFINADDTSVLHGEPGNVLQYNLFAYCSNNPINHVDEGGYFGTPIQWACAAVGAIAGWFFGDYVAKALGYKSGWKYWAIRTGVVVGGTVIGWFVGSAITKIVTKFLTKHPNICQKLPQSVKKFFGTNAKCFVAGTMVATENGYKPIEEIEAGEWVWATDPETGEKCLKQVLQTFENETDELAHVWVNGEEIVCTPGHKFYSPKKGWTDAINLKAGDMLQLLNGGYVVVEAVQHEFLEYPVTVYNFEVQDFHTYYVGTDVSVLVHNANCLTVKEFLKGSKNAKQVLSYLKDEGFKVFSQEGSHVKLVKGSKTVIVPKHGSTDIKIGTLRSIFKQAGLL